MATIYVDPEDEITGAIARLRSAPDRQAVMVLPAGSRIATSRINFRLLAREASERGIDLVVVSDHPEARALAISAGVPAYDTVAAADGALAQFRAQDVELATRTGRRRGEGALLPSDATRIMATPTTDRPAREATAPLALDSGPDAGAAPAAGGTRTARAAGHDVATAEAARERVMARRRRRPRVLPLLIVAALLLVAAGVGYGAYLLLPTATVTLRPDVTTVGPLDISITADPDVAVPDPAAAVVPAQRLSVTVSVAGTFAASGSRVSQSRASGTVRFRSENTVFEVPIPVGTRVSTADGLQFETTRAVTLPRASFATGPTTVEAPIRALRGGPRGNVDAGAITRVPNSLSAALVTVRNPEPTSGGRRDEVPVVTQEDYDAAVAALTAELPAEVDRALADPAVTPRGLTLFPVSAEVGDPVPEPPADEIVDAEGEQFTLALDAPVSALAVNEALVDELAQEQASARLPPGASVLDVSTERSSGIVIGSAVAYRVHVSAQAYRPPDRDAIVARLRGVSVSEATAIMAEYGTAELTVWPEFIDRLPDQPARISLIVLPPQENG